MTLVGAGLLAIALAADPPLTITRASTASQVDLRNTGTRPINAWAFAVSTPNPNGGIHRVFYSADVYMSEVTGDLQGAAPHLRVLMPSERRAVPVDAMPADATIQTIAVIFDDNSAVGDEQTIAGLFQKRAADRDELKQVVDAFASVLSSARGNAALRSLQQRFAVGGSAEESAPRRSARDAVNAWLQRPAGASDADVDRAIQSYVEFVTRQHSVAEKRAARRD